MEPVVLLITLIAVLVLALAGSAYANHRQEVHVQKQRRIQYIRRNAEYYVELATAIASMSEKPALAKELNRVAIALFQQILTIDSAAHYVNTAIENALEFAERLGQRGNETPLTAFSSDAEIARAHSYLNQAERVFRGMRDKADISSETFAEFHQELRWLYLRCEVDSLTNQGTLAAQRKDRVKSLAYYQKALNILKKSSIIDPRKQMLIKDISQRLNAAPEDSSSREPPSSQRRQSA